MNANYTNISSNYKSKLGSNNKDSLNNAVMNAINFSGAN